MTERDCNHAASTPASSVASSKTSLKPKSLDVAQLVKTDNHTVETLRKMVTMLFMLIYHNGKIKVPNSWNPSNKPKDWPDDVPFIGPNSGVKNENDRWEKPTKDTLFCMYKFLQRKYKNAQEEHSAMEGRSEVMVTAMYSSGELEKSTQPRPVFKQTTNEDRYQVNPDVTHSSNPYYCLDELVDIAAVKMYGGHTNQADDFINQNNLDLVVPMSDDEGQESTTTLVQMTDDEYCPLTELSKGHCRDSLSHENRDEDSSMTASIPTTVEQFNCPLSSASGPPLSSASGPPLYSASGPPLSSASGFPLSSANGPPLSSASGPPLSSASGPPVSGTSAISSRIAYDTSWLTAGPTSLPLVNRLEAGPSSVSSSGFYSGGTGYVSFSMDPTGTNFS